jgi:hypothetical protein
MREAMREAMSLGAHHALHGVLPQGTVTPPPLIASLSLFRPLFGNLSHCFSLVASLIAALIAPLSLLLSLSQRSKPDAHLLEGEAISLQQGERDKQSRSNRGRETNNLAPTGGERSNLSPTGGGRNIEGETMRGRNNEREKQ